jgi:hypothetical protein
MTRDINRFVTVTADHVNDLIGNPRASEFIHAAPDGLAEARRLYAEALRSAARFVRFFQMRDARDCPIYDLFFATNNAVGHERMKEAMWAADGTGGFTFSEGTDPNQLALLEPDPGVEAARLLLGQFAGQRIAAEDAHDWASRSSRYIRKHVTDALRRMEQPGGIDGRQIVVEELKRDGRKRRPRMFSAGTWIRFPGGGPRS